MVRVERELARIREREGARERDLDILRFELEEIEAAEPDPAEEDELAPERERLRHAESLRGAAAEALAAVCGDGERRRCGGDGLRGVGPRRRRRASTPSSTSWPRPPGGCGSSCRSWRASCADTPRGSRPSRAGSSRSRSASTALDRLKRKHGGTIESVLAHAEHCRAEIETIEGAGGDDRAVWRPSWRRPRAERTDLAGQLSEVRAKSARRLEKRVAAELDQLAMSGAKLEVSLEPHPDGFGPLGQERVTFQVATNPGHADLAAARRGLRR